MYAEELLMTSLTWWWWMRSLASVVGGVAQKLMTKHLLDGDVCTRVCLDGLDLDKNSCRSERMYAGVQLLASLAYWRWMRSLANVVGGVVWKSMLTFVLCNAVCLRVVFGRIVWVEDS